MTEKEKTTVVSLSSIKCGTGKTHAAILLANRLAVAGKRVLITDSDFNNSLSFHYLDTETIEKTRKLNIAAALGDESNNLCGFAVPTVTPGVSLIASSPYLADLRTVSEKRLKRMVPALYGVYDILPEPRSAVPETD
jgi:chromosome partitioning protein